MDDSLRELASGQLGLIAARQLHGLGLNAHGIAHRVERGVLRWRSSHVLELVGTMRDARQDLMAATLDAGPRSAISHTTALGHWGVRGAQVHPIHVIRHRDHLDHAVRGVVVHEVRYLPHAEVRVLEGIPTVSPALGLLQAAGMSSVSDGRLARLIDAAWADRLVSFRTLWSITELMSRQGRRGLVRFRALVDERGPAYTPPASNLEARFEEILARAELPPMRRQVDSGDGLGWIGRVDFRAADMPLIVEVQSERFHRGLTAEAADETRIAKLRRAGFQVVEVTDVDVYHRPRLVTARVAAERARLGNARRRSA